MAINLKGMIKATKEMRCIATYTPGELKGILEDYKRAFETIKPAVSEALGYDFSKVQLIPKGSLAIYGKLLKFVRDEAVKKDPDARVMSNLAMGIAGVVVFPFYSANQLFLETMTFGDNIHLNTSHLGARIGQKNSGADIRGNLEREIVEDLASIYWKQQTLPSRKKGEPNWKIGFENFVSLDLLASEYSVLPNKVLYERAFPDARVMRIREIAEREGLQSVLELPRTWANREGTQSMLDYITQNEPQETRERRAYEIKTLLKVMLPFLGIGIGTMVWQGVNNYKPKDSKNPETISVSPTNQSFQVDSTNETFQVEGIKN